MLRWWMVLLAWMVTPAVFAAAVKLDVQAIGPVVAGTPFNVEVRAANNGNARTAVVATTTVTLTLTAGPGVIGGTVSGNILSGEDNVVIMGVELLTAGSGVVLTASASGGDALTADPSDPFTVSPGAATQMTILTTPSATATAGAAFAQQPVLQIKDAHGNVVAGDSTTVVTAAISTGGGTLQGTPVTATASSGLVTFATLNREVAGTITLNFTAAGLTGAVSGDVVVSAAAAARVTLLTAPSATATAGVAFGQQPAVRIEDVFGNLRLSDGTTVVTASVGTGGGTLQGSPVTATASGGIATFATLNRQAAGTITLAFTASGLTGTVSGDVEVSAGAAAQLAIQIAPSATATAGVAFAQQPVLHVQDTFGNRVLGDNTTVVTASIGSGGGTLQGSPVTATASAGVVTFATLNREAAATITLAFAATGLSGTTSGNVVVSAAAAVRLTLQTAPSATATAGVAFVQQPMLHVEDTFGNRVLADSTTVVTASIASGGGTLQGSPVTATASAGVVTFATLNREVAGTIALDFAASGLTGALSGNVVVSAAAAARLTVSTTPSATATAGVAFAQQPGVRIEDAFGNLRLTDGTTVVTASIASGGGTLQGSPLTATASGGIATFATLNREVAGTITLGFAASGLASTVSSNVVVSAATAVRIALQAAPSATATAGVAFTQQPVLHVEDTFGNRVLADSTTVVTASISTGGGTLQGSPVTATASTGVVTFATLNREAAGTITLAFVAPGLTGTLSGNVVVSAAAAARLSVLTAPSVTATAGVALAQQPAVRIEDAFGNLRLTDGTTVVTASIASGGGTLQGSPVTATASGGIATFATLNREVAGTITLGFAASGLTGTVSGNVVVSAAAAARVTVLTAPSATATAGVAFAQQPAVRIEDTFGNLCLTDGTTVVTASIATGGGTLQGSPLTATASGGIATFATLNREAAGTITLGFAAPGLASTVSGNVVVSATTAVRITLQTPPSGTATAGVAFAQQPVLHVEDTFGNRVLADSTTVVTASISTGGGTLQGSPTTATANAGIVTFVTLNREVAGTITLAFVAPGLSGVLSGNVVVSAAPAARVAILTPPSATAMAGVALAQQPVVRIEDAFGNLRLSDGTTVVTATASSGAVQGTATATATAGVATFTTLACTGAGTITLTFAASGLTSAVSGNVVVTAAAAVKLTLQTGPSATATAGVAFAQQPVVRIEDTFGNLVQADSTTLVTASIASGGGTLQGTPVTATAIAGVATFATLNREVAGTITLGFSTTGLASTLSGNVVVSAAASVRISLQTPPSATAAAGVAFAQQPTLHVEDSFGNLVLVDNATVVTASISTGGGTLQGSPVTATASGGIATFATLNREVAATITIGFAAPGLIGAVSGNVVVTAAAAARVTISMAPSATATAGVVFAQQPVLRIEDAFGNLRLSDGTTVVTASIASGGGTLQGSSLTATASGGIATFATLNREVAGTITLGFAASGLVSAVSGDVVVSAAAAARITLLASPSGTATAGVAFIQQPVLQVEDIFGNRLLTDNTTEVTASIATGGGTLQGSPVTAMASAGVVSFATLNREVAATITLGFAAPGLTGTVSGNLVVTAATAARVTIVTPPSVTATAGVAFAQQPVVRIEDAFGNLRLTDGTTVVTASVSSGGGGVQGTNTATASAGVAAFTTLACTGTGALTLEFAAPGLVSAFVGNVVVSAAAATRLVITGVGTQVAGAAQGLTITARDPFGNQDSAYVGSRALLFSGPSSGPLGDQPTITDAAGTAIALGTSTTLTFVAGQAATGGGANGSLRLYRAQSVLLVVSDLASGGPVGVGADALALSVNEDVASRLAFTQQPGVATAGSSFAQQPHLRTEDAFGNPSLLGLGASVVVQASLLSGGGTLLGTLGRDLGTLAPDVATGVVQFVDLRLDHAAGAKVLQFATTLNGVPIVLASAPFAVAPAAAQSLRVLGAASATAGVGTALTVHVEDAFGNIVTTFPTQSLSVDLQGVSDGQGGEVATLSDAAGVPQAVAGGANTTLSFVAGIASAAEDADQGLLRPMLVEVASITASGGGLVAGAPLLMTVNAGVPAKLKITALGSTTPTAGDATTIAVVTQDLGGNVVPATSRIDLGLASTPTPGSVRAGASNTFIAAGASSTVIGDVILDHAEAGAVLTVSDAAGVLAPVSGPAMTVGNDQPVLAIGSGTLTYAGGSGASPFGSPGIAVRDVNSAGFAPFFAGATLTVSFVSGAVLSEDLLQVRSAGAISVSGTTVSYNATPVATVAGGFAGAPLVVQLTGTAAGWMAVEALLDNLCYHNIGGVSPTTGIRTVRLDFDDGSTAAPGGALAAVPVTRDLDVVVGNALPTVVANTGLSVTRSTTTTITTANLQVIDEESGAGAIHFTVVGFPSEGELRLGAGAAPVVLAPGGLTSFTQADIAAGAVSYRHLGSSQPGDAFTFIVDDGTNQLPLATFAFTVPGAASNPVLFVPLTTVSYQEGAAATVLVPAAPYLVGTLVSDADTFDFANGTLTIEVIGANGAADADAGDRLSLRSQALAGLAQAPVDVPEIDLTGFIALVDDAGVPAVAHRQYPFDHYWENVAHGQPDPLGLPFPSLSPPTSYPPAWRTGQPLPLDELIATVDATLDGQGRALRLNLRSGSGRLGDPRVSAQAVGRLIDNLQFANTSDDPPAARTRRLRITLAEAAPSTALGVADLALVLRPVNDPPVFTIPAPAPAPVQVIDAVAGVPLRIRVLAGDPDLPSGAALVYALPSITPPSAGVATINATSGALEFTPLPTFAGVVTLAVQASDDQGLPTAAAVAVNVLAGPTAQGPLVVSDPPFESFAGEALTYPLVIRPDPGLGSPPAASVVVTLVGDVPFGEVAGVAVRAQLVAGPDQLHPLLEVANLTRPGDGVYTFGLRVEITYAGAMGVRVGYQPVTFKVRAAGAPN